MARFESAQKHLMKFYSEKSDLYERLTKCEDREGRIIKNLLKDIDLKGKTVLDLGAGTGRFAFPLSSKAKQVYALDKTPEFLRILRRKVKAKRKRNIKALHGTFGKIPLPKESVDIACSFWAFPFHSTSWERDLKEIKRVLKPGGVISVMVTHYAGAEYQRLRKMFYPPGEKRGRKIHGWLLKKGFKRKSFNIRIAFGSPKGVKDICGEFFGREYIGYLLPKKRTGFDMRVSLCYWKKK